MVWSGAIGWPAFCPFQWVLIPWSPSDWPDFPDQNQPSVCVFPTCAHASSKLLYSGKMFVLNASSFPRNFHHMESGRDPLPIRSSPVASPAPGLPSLPSTALCALPSIPAHPRSSIPLLPPLPGPGPSPGVMNPWEGTADHRTQWFICFRQRRHTFVEGLRGNAIVLLNK